MEDTFVFDEEIENILKLINKDNSLLDKLNVDELETLDNYLNKKKNYLKSRRK